LIVNVVTNPVGVANALRPTLLKLSRSLQREASEFGVTPMQVSVLGHISRGPWIGIGALAKLEGVSPPRMSLVVQKLVEQGLVTSERGADRRRVGLHVTRDATNVLRSVRSRRTAWLSSRLQRLDPDELETIDAAIPLLAKLVEDA
jgi:DNA-binding MarR family transcriptional regulator